MSGSCLGFSPCLGGTLLWLGVSSRMGVVFVNIGRVVGFWTKMLAFDSKDFS